MKIFKKCSVSYSVILLVLMGVVSRNTSAIADTTLQKATPKNKLHPSLVQVQDTPGLPRVLLIGDSISMHYTLEVRELLKGVANVHRPACNCHSTLQVADELDSYFGDGPWDVIHFNCGIHDLTHLNGAGKATAPPEGKVRVPLDRYKKNLRTIVDRLKKTNAKLVWATSTPIGTEYEQERGYRRNRDILAYNVAAAEIMKAEGIAINDLYSVVYPTLDELQKDGVHYHTKGSSMLAMKVAKAIRKKLKISP